MNHEKARELFSTYYEGTLSPGLRFALERRLAADESIRADYARFERLMQELGTLAVPALAPPSDLHERISARLDRHVYENRHATTPPFIVWWRSVVGATLVAAGLLFAVISFQGRSGMTTASMLPGDSVDALKVESASNGIDLTYSARDNRHVVIREGADGRILTDRDVAATTLKSHISNGSGTPRLITFAVQGEAGATMIAIPGTARKGSRQGSGTIEDFALNLAGLYGLPVEFSSSNASSHITWRLDASEPIEAASNELADASLRIEKQDGGLLKIY